ncbi:hypothetical protein E3N88_32229 [Mikania micrantha]|uniref:ARID domain-containing protein n=1 Tax=Mikania micrantha TaxID=192012 RepID=A0A5N6M7X6_9ASTR|nr:hypothetical protein E3N88_32229 [Mikania micrantha]
MKNNQSRSILGIPLYSGIRTRKKMGFDTKNPNFYHVRRSDFRSPVCNMNCEEGTYRKRGSTGVQNSSIVARNFGRFRSDKQIRCVKCRKWETDLGKWNEYWVVNKSFPKHMTGNKNMLINQGYVVKFDGDVCHVYGIFEDENPCESDGMMYEYVKGVGYVNLDDVCFNPIVIDSFEGCYLFFEMFEEPNYVVKYKRQLQSQIDEVIEWFFKRIGQPDSKRYPPMLPNGEEVEFLDLYMFVKPDGGYNRINDEKWEEIDQYMGISTPYAVNLKPIFVGYLKLFLFFYDRFKLEGKGVLDACIKTLKEIKERYKELNVMEEQIGNFDAVNVGENVSGSAAVFDAIHEGKDVKEVQITSQDGNIDNEKDFVEDLDDFVVIKDEEPPNEV